MNIVNKITSYIAERLPFTALNVAMAKYQKTEGLSQTYITKQQQLLRAKDLEDWKRAIAMATDPEQPNKMLLRQLYDNLEQDNHLSSVIESRIAKTQQSPFKICNKQGERIEELNDLFETVWFQEFVRLVLMSKFQGTTLIELFELNHKGELEEINEINQMNFNPLRGEIIKDYTTQRGISYREGIYAKHYLQIGKDFNDLGQYALVAPIVLAKKLGLGSWLDYIEKYGVPPLFITTDREDDKRLYELEEMASHFLSNGFMIGRGTDKFEIPNITKGSDTAFDTLIVRADNEISKRFLGGTGLTDEKGFVGSVEVQFELASYRFASDKLLVQSVINNKLIPMLVNLSPTYSKLKDMRFEWDDEEKMTSEKLIELVQTLGNYYDFDPEQIENITGLKIVGIKSNNLPVEVLHPQKKK